MYNNRKQGNSVARDLPPTGSEANTTTKLGSHKTSTVTNYETQQKCDYINIYSHYNTAYVYFAYYHTSWGTVGNMLDVHHLNMYNLLNTVCIIFVQLYIILLCNAVSITTQ